MKPFNTFKKPNIIAKLINFRFPKKQKLKKKKEVELLFQNGEWHTSRFLKIVVLKLPAESGIKIGVSISKKNFKKAVDRNRIKRLMREAYRLNQNTISDRFGNSFSAMFIWVSDQKPRKLNEIEDELFSILKKYPN